MSRLKEIRQNRNLTQEELCDRSRVSVRTIQRLEAGARPKGQTLKILAAALEVKENELISEPEDQVRTGLTFIKIINLSSLPVCFMPPVNFALPVIIMFFKRQFDPLAKQIISVQIMWSIFAVIIFMLAAFMKNWFSLGNNFMLVIMILLVLSNVYIILRNAAEIDKKGKLYFRLNFNLI